MSCFHTCMITSFKLQLLTKSFKYLLVLRVVYLLHGSYSALEKSHYFLFEEYNFMRNEIFHELLFAFHLEILIYIISIFFFFFTKEKKRLPFYLSNLSR